jgi:predicted TIM-barrel fold metal-dependent hydrolase
VGQPLARGASRFLWASDYPHADHTVDYLKDLEDLAAALPERDRRQFLGDNVRALFAIEGRRA